MRIAMRPRENGIPSKLDGAAAVRDGTEVAARVPAGGHTQRRGLPSRRAETRQQTCSSGLAQVILPSSIMSLYVLCSSLVLGSWKPQSERGLRS